jgi:SAM-dependent methyltransferase
MLVATGETDHPAIDEIGDDKAHLVVVARVAGHRSHQILKRHTFATATRHSRLHFFRRSNRENGSRIFLLTGKPGSYAHVKRMKAWYEKDEFWETVANLMFAGPRWAAAPVEIEEVVALLSVKAPAAILDLCCGPGRHSLELARRGFRVTGVDRTLSYLEKARQQAAEEKLEVEFVQEDMRRFSRPEAFDGVINLFTSFGYFENPAEDRQVLVNLHRSLKPGGALVMDSVGKEVLARIFRERDWREEDGVILLEERRISKDWSWIDNRWILLKDQSRQEFRVSHRLYSAAEMTALLKGCGFDSVEIYGDLTGVPYDHTANRLVAVARK